MSSSRSIVSPNALHARSRAKGISSNVFSNASETPCEPIAYLVCITLRMRLTDESSEKYWRAGCSSLPFHRCRRRRNFVCLSSPSLRAHSSSRFCMTQVYTIQFTAVLGTILQRFGTKPLYKALYPSRETVFWKQSTTPL
jgi:hypothetical protein